VHSKFYPDMFRQMFAIFRGRRCHISYSSNSVLWAYTDYDSSCVASCRGMDTFHNWPHRTYSLQSRYPDYIILAHLHTRVYTYTYSCGAPNRFLVMASHYETSRSHSLDTPQSAQIINLYLTIRNTRTRQTSMQCPR
jgi:hypothetical protein